MTPLVSILVPCHNASAWIRETLDSALAQTWPRCEIIVVDDGSTDDSLALARAFGARGIRVVAQSNQGASAARNHAVRLSRGEFIQFLDADDLLSPGKIAAQVALLAVRPVGTLATCAWGRFTGDPKSARFVDDAVFRDFAPCDFLVLAGNTGAMMHPSAWLVPRDIAARAGPWNAALSLNDDGEYFCRVLLASTGMAFSADANAKSFYRSGLLGSLSNQRGENARRSHFKSLELIEHHLLAAEDSPRTRRALANHWQRFVHDFFPKPADLITKAEARVVALGGATHAEPPMGPKTAALACAIGWKNTWRLKSFLNR